MMAIQTIVNRLGALLLGASEFTFATVVAANVLCIAPGSFAVARLRALPRALLWNQWLLFVSLAALYFALDQAPYWMHLLRLAFGNSDGDFYRFYLACFGAVLAVLGLPILCSGATRSTRPTTSRTSDSRARRSCARGRSAVRPRTARGSAGAVQRARAHCWKRGPRPRASASMRSG
ncbi:MAG: hypothetical protein E6J87_21720 [Deltaproteobacteria bacterium]|nr:MAG: hypothetical protein E6J87_21720 [Deltaproteobacteria bacterium]